MKPENQSRAVAFVNDGLLADFNGLKNWRFEDRELFGFINRALDDLEENPFCGIKLSKRLWPKGYIKKYRIRNLWKYDLPNGWRLIYFVRISEIKIVAIVLEWLDHKKYERKFGYG